MTDMAEVVEMEGVVEQMKPDSTLTPEERATQLPIPKGYKILCAVPELGKTYEDSIIERPVNFMQREQQGTVVLFVMALGAGCYADTARYPGGAFCQKGDFVICRTYAGTRFTIHGKAFALINDDEVAAVVSDPRGIGR